MYCLTLQPMEDASCSISTSRKWSSQVTSTWMTSPRDWMGIRVPTSQTFAGEQSCVYACMWDTGLCQMWERFCSRFVRKLKSGSISFVTPTARCILVYKSSCLVLQHCHKAPQIHTLVL